VRRHIDHAFRLETLTGNRVALLVLVVLAGLKKDGAAAGAEQALYAAGWLPRCLRTSPPRCEKGPTQSAQRDVGAEAGDELRDQETADDVPR